jgi:hypothetical protein
VLPLEPAPAPPPPGEPAEAAKAKRARPKAAEADVPLLFDLAAPLPDAPSRGG